MVVWRLWKQNYVMCLMGHQLLISCTKFVFLFKRVSPLSLLILSFAQRRVAQFLFFFSPSDSPPLFFILSVPLVDCKASLWEEAHPSCQSQSGTLVRRVRGLVSKVNEVAGTRNICQRGSDFLQLLEPGRRSSVSPHHGTPAVSALATGPTDPDSRGTHMERDRLFTLSSEHTR